MVQASLTGLFDFTGYDPFDKWCRRRLHWALNELVRRSNLSYYSSQFTRETSLLAVARGTDAWEETQQRVNEVLDKIHGGIFWWQTSELKSREAEQLGDVWENYFGAVDSPEVQEMLAKGLAHMRQMAET